MQFENHISSFLSPVRSEEILNCVHMCVRGCQLVNRFNRLLNSSASYISKQVKTNGKITLTVHRPMCGLIFSHFPQHAMV